jgi:hypothetical protein
MTKGKVSALPLQGTRGAVRDDGGGMPQGPTPPLLKTLPSPSPPINQICA